jgi:MerR family transcriptional regulator, redox-sensitive transcriptional activator SoxR
MTVDPTTHPVDGERRLLTIGELAARCGVATSALRFYEERALIHSHRTDSGHRRYWPATIRRVAFIVFAQRVGLTLEEIRCELDLLPADRAPTGDDWGRLSTKWTQRIEERIRELTRLQRGLSDCIGCGCLSLERCHILNPADRAATLGPGPRFWLDDAARALVSDSAPPDPTSSGRRSSRSGRGGRR